ncbi:MAG: hypothetical protein O7G88_15700 [bacterium]|nr:hypothetical protein [bacterium]
MAQGNCINFFQQDQWDVALTLDKIVCSGIIQNPLSRMDKGKF